MLSPQLSGKPAPPTPPLNPFASRRPQERRDPRQLPDPHAGFTDSLRRGGQSPQR